MNILTAHLHSRCIDLQLLGMVCRRIGHDYWDLPALGALALRVGGHDGVDDASPISLLIVFMKNEERRRNEVGRVWRRASSGGTHTYHWLSLMSSLDP